MRRLLLITPIMLVLCTSCGIFMDAVLVREKKPELFKKEMLLTKEAGDSLAMKGIIATGQTERQVIKAWGKPTRRSGCSVNGDPRRLLQLVYPERLTYVYLLGGHVTGTEPMWRDKKLQY